MHRLRRGYVLRNVLLGDFVVVRTCTYTNLESTLQPTTHLGCMVLFLGYKPEQHVTVLNTAGVCNTMVLLHYTLLGTPSYLRSVVNRNVVMRRIPVRLAVLSGSYLQINIAGNEASFTVPTAAEERPRKACSVPEFSCRVPR